MRQLLRSLALAAMLVVGVGTASSTYADAPAKPTPAKPVKAELVDINSASQKDLEALPGVGEAYAKKIVAGRPYDNKSQLKSRKIVPESTYDKFSDKIIAKQPKK